MFGASFRLPASATKSTHLLEHAMLAARQAMPDSERPNSKPFVHSSLPICSNYAGNVPWFLGPRMQHQVVRVAPAVELILQLAGLCGTEGGSAVQAKEVLERLRIARAGTSVANANRPSAHAASSRGVAFVRQNSASGTEGLHSVATPTSGGGASPKSFLARLASARIMGARPTPPGPLAGKLGKPKTKEDAYSRKSSFGPDSSDDAMTAAVNKRFRLH